MQSIIVNVNGQPFEREFEGEQLSPAIASRQTDPDFNAALAYLPNPDEVLAKLGEKISVYENMLADPQVWSAFEKLCDGAKRHKYELRQGKLDTRAFQLLKDYFDEFKWGAFIEQVLRARLFGFQPMEIIWHNVEGAILPASIEARPQARFLFKSDDNTPLLITKDEKNGLWNPEWNNSFIFPKYHATLSPYGTAVLSRCFWNVVAKRGGLKWWMVFVEKYGTPWLLISAPNNSTTEQMNALATAGQRAIRDAVLVMKEGHKAEILESAGKTQSGGAHESFLKYHDDQISRAITSETLTSGNNGVGSYAASQTAESILDTAINSCVELVTETAEELARKIEFLNTNTGAVIMFESYDPMFTNKGLAELDLLLFKIGVEPTPEYVVKAYKRQLTDFTIKSTAGASQPVTFAGEVKIPSDQLAIDKLGDSAFSNSDVNQAAMKAMLAPVLKFIEGEESFESATKGLAELFPKMNSTELQKMMFKLIATAKAWGEMNAGSEE